MDHNEKSDPIEFTVSLSRETIESAVASVNEQREAEGREPIDFGDGVGYVSDMLDVSLDEAHFTIVEMGHMAD